MQDHYSPSQVTYCWGDLVAVRSWKLHCSCVGAWRTWEGRTEGGSGEEVGKGAKFNSALDGGDASEHSAFIFSIWVELDNI